MDAELRRVAADARGFMPADEGLALHAWAQRAVAVGPVLEIGTYCGKSTVYLAAGAAAAGGPPVVSIDHHRGSAEHQPGWPYHEPDLLDEAGTIDTLPHARATLARAGLEGRVVLVVGDSPQVARLWGTPLGMAFVDGAHTDEAAAADYEGWAPHVACGGVLAVHDVFTDPSEGGQAPRRIYRRALDSGAFAERDAVGSLRVLERTASGW